MLVCLAGCGSGDNIWVKGVLQKGGEMYKPPEGRKLALYFCPMQARRRASPPATSKWRIMIRGMVSFTVPGREGYGIPPGKYRIAVVETIRREALDKLKKPRSRSAGKRRINNDTNLLEATFGETTSPFVSRLENVDQPHAGHVETQWMRVFLRRKVTVSGRSAGVCVHRLDST